METVETEKFIRKPLYVDAVRLSAENFDAIAAWCQGEVVVDDETVPGKKYIKVRVHNPKNPRQTKAFVGDWLLYTERGYKVYTNKAFRASFDPVVTEEKNEGTAVAATVPPGEEIAYKAEALVPVDDEVLADVPPPVDEAVRAEVREQAAQTDTVVTAVVAPPVPDNVEQQPKQESVVPAAAEGKRVLSIQEQRELGQEEIRELIKSGEVVLAQDLAESPQ